MTAAERRTLAYRDVRIDALSRERKVAMAATKRRRETIESWAEIPKQFTT